MRNSKFLPVIISLLLVIGCIAPVGVYATDPARDAPQIEKGVSDFITKALPSGSGGAPAELAVSAGQSAEELVQALVGNTVAVSGITYTGTGAAIGYFTGGSDSIGFSEGIVLSSGNVYDVVGPNELDYFTSDFGMPGDNDLTNLVGEYETNDAAVLEFDFIPQTDEIHFSYVFASDEYNEFVNSPFNDVFGFFVNGKNVALIPGTDTPVSINNVNGGKPYGVDAMNSEYYRNNDLSDGGGAIYTEMDGLTTVLPVDAKVNPGVKNHIKLAVADVSDFSYDSAVFIKAGSFTDLPPQTVGFDHETYTVDESAGSATITVSRDTSVGLVNVSYSTANGTAKAGEDYNSVSGTLTFAPGEAVKTFTVPILDDQAVEADETVKLTLSDAPAGVAIDPEQADLVISDDDTAKIYLNTDSGSIAEDDPSGMISLHVYRNSPIGEVSINYATFDETASASSDYTSISGILTFAAGETEKTVSIPISDDKLIEGDEVLHFTLSEPTGETVLGEPHTAAFTILDDEGIRFTQENYEVSESATYAAIGVMLKGYFATAGELESPTVSAIYTTANGSATAGADYTSVSGIVYFIGSATEPGAVYDIEDDTEPGVVYDIENDTIVKTFYVPILQDKLKEGDETVKLTLSDAFGVLLGHPYKATLTIADYKSPDGGGGGGGGGSVETPPPVTNLVKGTLIDRMEGYVALSKPVKFNDVKNNIELAYDTSLLNNKANSPRIYYWNADKKNWVALATYSVNDQKVKAVNDGKYKGWFVVFGVVQPEFSDVQANWAEQVINRMNGLGMVEGYPSEDGSLLRTVLPERNVSHAEFTMFISRILNIDIHDPKLPLISKKDARSLLSASFTDGDKIPDWVLQAAGTLNKNDLLPGNSSEFNADTPITRIEAAVMISKALDVLTETKTADLSKFTDSSEIPDWAKGELAEGTITGYLDGTFRPNEPLTRAEALTLLHRLFVEGLGW